MASRVAAHLRGNVVAYLAVFLALGGTAYAAGKIGTKQLKNNAVKTKKIANGAVTNPKIASNAVNAGKIANGSISEGKLANGAAVAKAYGVVQSNANSPGEPVIDQSRSRGINSVSRALDGVDPVDGMVCVDVAKPFSVALATGNDEAGAASPVAFASVNYNPSSGIFTCPAASDLRVTTRDGDNAGFVTASFSLVLF